MRCRCPLHLMVNVTLCSRMSSVRGHTEDVFSALGSTMQLGHQALEHVVGVYI